MPLAQLQTWMHLKMNQMLLLLLSQHLRQRTARQRGLLQLGQMLLLLLHSQCKIQNGGRQAQVVTGRHWMLQQGLRV